MSAAITPQLVADGRKESIVLQFSRPDPASENVLSRIVSKGICDETRSEICHVDCEVDGLLIGAHSSGGIQARPQDYQNWMLRIRVRIPASKTQKAAYETYARSMIGTPYDTTSIFGIALNQSSLHDASKLICSAFGKLAVDNKSFGIVTVRKVYYLTSPEELRIAASATAGAEEIRIEGNGPLPPFAMAVAA